ncbi:hypothetical protein [Streptomyces sp. TRM68416]|uniref:hypothetical protein n=1 Tax=Streptomyces sp. TRM68416 TaxID=2758412 RepID=UPI001661DF89|nr:hypothetical protein [Streptomyces sp. TRM68416]MBD0839307.1 hypothetical protein [Streptomyces sp. TRM68416]
MADEQYRWLDPETAERLLSGESLEAVDAADRDQAERLAKTLEALTAEPPLSSAELPGEAAALAAFRSARADAPAPVGRPARHRSPDAGLVRIGGPAHGTRRPRWARPARLGLAAALALGLVGGVAVAAGTGVLPQPFGDDEPTPASSVTVEPTPGLPLAPQPSQGAGESEPAPDGKPSHGETATGGPAPDPGSSADEEKGRADGWKGSVTSACRDIRDGRRLNDDRRRALEGAAGGSARVSKYCSGLLVDRGTSHDGSNNGSGNGNGKGKGGATGGRGTGQDDHNGQDDDEGHRPGQGAGQGGHNGRGGGEGHRPGQGAGRGGQNGQGGHNGQHSQGGQSGRNGQNSHNGQGGHNGQNGRNGQGHGESHQPGQGGRNGQGDGEGHQPGQGDGGGHRADEPPSRPEGRHAS